MRKLVLILVASIALITFIKAYDEPSYDETPNDKPSYDLQSYDVSSFDNSSMDYAGKIAPAGN